jgi:hypothetical protein
MVTLQLAVIHAQDGEIRAAQTAVEAWLSLIDRDNYAESWETAATVFKAAVSQEKWHAAAKGARAPLGQLNSRVLKSATATATLPGAPDGEYVVFQFNTGFEHKAAAVETVTAIHEKDHSWHVGGYFIK